MGRRSACLPSNRFRNYLRNAESLFNERGLVSVPNFLWERALLCVGDKAKLFFFIDALTDRVSRTIYKMDEFTSRLV